MSYMEEFKDILETYKLDITYPINLSREIIKEKYKIGIKLYDHQITLLNRAIDLENNSINFKNDYVLKQNKPEYYKKFNNNEYNFAKINIGIMGGYGKIREIICIIIFNVIK
jgi:hypothetical protein